MTLKILYITGFSRSGSTLLDTVLSASPGMFGAGELVNLIPAMDERGEYCACGEQSSACPVWRRVRTEWARTGLGLTDCQYLTLDRQFTRYRRVLDYRRGAVPRTADFDRYIRSTRALFAAITKITDSDWVIDSSKNPMRAFALAQMPDTELRVIHLVRDIRGVVHSRRKSQSANPKAGVVSAAPGLKPRQIMARWLICNAVADRVRTALGPQAMLLRYEDFLADPAAAVMAVGGLTQTDVQALVRRVREDDSFTPEHTVAGNRIRMSGGIRIRRNVAWRRELSSVYQCALPTLTSPLSFRYGYWPRLASRAS